MRLSEGAATVILVEDISIIAICGIFFLILHYCFKKPPGNPSPAITDTTSAPAIGPAGGLGLVHEELDALPTFFYYAWGRGAGEGEEECAVCLGRFQSLQKVRRLPACGHCFHTQCIDEWLRGNRTCPLCRRRVDSEHAVVIMVQAAPAPVSLSQTAGSDEERIQSPPPAGRRRGDDLGSEGNV